MSFTVTTNLATGYTFAIDTLTFDLGQADVPAVSMIGLAALALAVLAVGGGVITSRRRQS